MILMIFTRSSIFLSESSFFLKLIVCGGKEYKYPLPATNKQTNEKDRAKTFHASRGLVLSQKGSKMNRTNVPSLEPFCLS